MTSEGQAKLDLSFTHMRTSKITRLSLRHKPKYHFGFCLWGFFGFWEREGAPRGGGGRLVRAVGGISLKKNFSFGFAYTGTGVAWSRAVTPELQTSTIPCA